jgi:lysophospholipase L1-like esterase
MPAPEENRSLRDKLAAARAQGGWGRVIAMAWARAIHPLELWLQRTAPERGNLWVVPLARLTGRRVVHVIGDSHTLMLSGHFPFRVTWMGAATAFNLGKAGSSTRSKEKLERALMHVWEGDVVLLVLGEVDSRIHIYQQHMRSGGAKSFESLIAATIERYGAEILELKRRGYRVVVHSVSATPYQENIYDAEYYADDATRAQIVDAFDAALKAWCQANAVEYLDMYSLVRDERGFIRKDLTTDGTHLDEAALPLYREWVRECVWGGGAK